MLDNVHNILRLTLCYDFFLSCDNVNDNVFSFYAEGNVINFL